MFGNILKMLFSYKFFTLSQPFSQHPTKFYIRKSTTIHTPTPTDNLPSSTQNPPPHNTETTKTPPPTPPQQQKKNQRSKRSSRSARKQIGDDPGKGLWVANRWESSFSTVLISKPIRSSKSDKAVSGLEIWIVTIRGLSGWYTSLSGWILGVGTRWRNSNSMVVVFGGFRFKREREIEKERDWRRELDGAISLLRLGLGRVSESFFLSLFLSQAVSVSPSFSLSRSDLKVK